MPDHAQGPIFIHSLFRSGSTWLFARFRSADAGYWCYQEPFHEKLSELTDEPQSLLSVHHRMADDLRHPRLEQPYFQEFYQIRADIGSTFCDCISFDSFFDPSTCPAFDEYTARLIRFAKGRPVLQCCRSFGRVSHLRQRHGGIHLHLWRNPWDQWWSYHINEYFSATNLAILNARNPPRLILALREAVGFDEFHKNTFREEYPKLVEYPLQPEDEYFIFYSLWLYSMIENHEICDGDLNIDCLSTDDDYAKNLHVRLENLGITGIDLSGCSVPQASFGPQDEAFFAKAEARAEQLFAAAGYEPLRLRAVQEKRNAARPGFRRSVQPAMAHEEQARAIARHLMEEKATAARRARQAAAVSIHHETEAARHKAAAELAEAGALQHQAEAIRFKANAAGAEARLFQSEAVILRHQKRVEQLTAAIGQTEGQLRQSKAQTERLSAAVEEAQTMLRQIHASRSWRITKPLRWLAWRSAASRRRAASLARRPLAAAYGIIAQTVITRVALHAGNRPGLKRALISALRAFPGLERRLRQVRLSSLYQNAPQSCAVMPIMSERGLSPSASRIYRDLKQALATRHPGLS
ncbi:MAG TPA: hypothetical protein VMU82_07700 [Acetobacteraceae bacterium]|nr:hypothetical protein [Acetobacteraceae bacterium]